MTSNVHGAGSELGYRGRGIHGAVVEELGRRILTGEVAQGATLDIASLEAELDVSRSVIREALRVLKAKGLIDARQKRGTFVQPRTEWTLLDPDVIRWQFEGQDSQQLFNDLNELRNIIEPAAAGLAALRRTEADLQALDASLAQMSEATHGVGDPVQADLLFHRALLAASHNELLIRTRIVLEPGLAARDQVVHDLVEDDDPTPAHAAVLDAIRRRDPDVAVSAASALLAKSLLDLDSIRSPASLPQRARD
ncbi:DNA-binding FadR family transcriptional regulator [Kribbella aluminosa]|uniref:DNA-binding FadR family transcriptional regulator n=1 Tax=Kribbella aluminosa TaxID=416017 RepID=A0ABS4UWM2_9ACTN|nr:FCD domain-containing protein [Kribbella aluminosa]MBP2356052.1 DNA-binding FadR family transcriptional regulator [Kribbella aluminosa]